jgi:hypothetical protein
LGGSTEGSLGGRLATRQAALREVMAAGSRLFYCCAVLADSVYSTSHATEKVFLETRHD